jgi:hypothetical protein
MTVLANLSVPRLRRLPGHVARFIQYLDPKVSFP